MFKPVLSPCLLDNSNIDDYNQQMIFCERLGNVVDFICDKTTLLFDLYTGSPYENGAIKSPTYTKLPIIKNRIQSILTKIYSNMEENLDLLHHNEQWNYCDMVVACDVTSASQCYINYCLSNNIIVVLFTACQSDIDCDNNNDEIQVVNDINDIPIKLSGILVPSDNPVFPKFESCQYYNDIFKSRNKGVNNQERRAIIKEFAEKVAKINGYTYSSELSNLNSIRFSAERQIYTSSYYYLSVDFESGGFEVFDKKLNHMGQYNFLGYKVKPAQKATHRMVIN